MTDARFPKDPSQPFIFTKFSENEKKKIRLVGWGGGGGGGGGGGAVGNFDACEVLPTF